LTSARVTDCAKAGVAEAAMPAIKSDAAKKTQFERDCAMRASGLVPGQTKKLVTNG
jgi:hypothetical protein